MKKILFFSLFLIFSSCFYKKSNYKLPNNQLNLFEVVKIDSIDDKYLIYAKRNDSIWKIVSSKNKVNNNCFNIIKKDDFYNFKIKSLFDDRFFQKRDIAGIRYNGTIIKLSDSLENVIWDLYISENIQGLCFINTSINTKLDTLR